MFKAKIIEDTAYYRLRRKYLIFLFLPAIPAAIIINFYALPGWLTSIGLIAYVLTLILSFRNLKVMSSLLGHRLIEIDAEAIRIKTKKGKEIETYSPSSLTRISVKDHYSIPHEGMSDLTREAKGKPMINFISILDDQKEHRFDFELNSHYMITQLEKVIAGWKKKGYVVVSVEPQ